MVDNFTPAEIRALGNSLKKGAGLHCPRCGQRLEVTPVVPSPNVSYVRNRLLLHCLHCRLKGAVDRK